MYAFSYMQFQDKLIESAGATTLQFAYSKVNRILVQPNILLQAVFHFFAPTNLASELVISYLPASSMATTLGSILFAYSPSQVPIFDGEHYDYWSSQMKIIFIYGNWL